MDPQPYYILLDDGHMRFVASFRSTAMEKAEQYLRDHPDEKSLGLYVDRLANGHHKLIRVIDQADLVDP